MSSLCTGPENNGDVSALKYKCVILLVDEFTAVCVLTVVCWMRHRRVVLQMTVGVVGYVGGEAAVPRPG